MSKVLVIGCGGVASVAIAKICQRDDIFSHLCIASRTLSKCDAMKEKWQKQTKTEISTAKIDANSKEQVIALIRQFNPDILLHLGMPYHNIILMQACAECKVHYIDTAAYEPENTNEPVWRQEYEKRCKEKGFVAYFDYTEQWSYNQAFKDAGVTALLGGGFDPGVTNVFVAYAKKTLFRPYRLRRHSRLQRWRPRLSFCYEFQHRNQSSRSIVACRLLRKWQMGGSASYVDKTRIRLPRNWNKRYVSSTPRRNRIAHQKFPGNQENAFLHDIWSELPYTHEMLRKRRYVAINTRKIRRT